MGPRNTIHSDILIVGAGFAGSLAAMALHKRGFSVCLVEKNSHPRFAIGESSTPIADMILRDFGDTYDLPWLKAFSRYGSWQKKHPEIVCGIKRGFSYYPNQKEESFTTDQHHRNELLVAASASDKNSDTNWMRSDFDAFMVSKVKDMGISYYNQTNIVNASRGDQWEFSAHRENDELTFSSSFFIDATGNSTLLSRILDVPYTSDDFLTHSRALFSHFDGVMHWSDMLDSLGISNADYPYNPDYSALHHLIDEGWIWILRFNNDRTSAGLVLDQNRQTWDETVSPGEIWEQVISSYPSIQNLFREAELAPEPGRFIQTGRLQRRLIRASGKGWVAFPYSAGFIDPLHSTGIAHTLTGVEKIIRAITEYWEKPEKLQKQLTQYEEGVFQELAFVDRLVGGAYKVLDNFELFNIWSMLYFTAAITYEQKRLKGEQPDQFLMALDPRIREIVDVTFRELLEIVERDNPSHDQVQKFRDTVRRRIEPFNVAGLLDPEASNMYHHTVAEL